MSHEILDTNRIKRAVPQLETVDLKDSDDGLATWYRFTLYNGFRFIKRVERDDNMQALETEIIGRLNPHQSLRNNSFQ